MSVKKILVALSLAAAQISLPLANGGAWAQTQHKKPAPQSSAITDMTDFNIALNIAVAKSIILDRSPENLARIAAILDSPALSPEFIAGVLSTEQAMKDPAYRKQAPRWVREAFPAIQIGNLQSELFVVAMAISMMRRTYADARQEIGTYCAEDRQKNFCPNVPALENFYRMHAQDYAPG